MKTPNLEQLTRRWTQLQRSMTVKAIDRKATIAALRQLLQETLDAGVYISQPTERMDLQSLARDIADAVFRLTKEYPSATIRAPREAKVEPPPRFDISRLPQTDYRIFGRERRLQELTDAWNNPKLSILSIIAFGGTGKTALVNHWLQDLRNDIDKPWGGADSVFVWSFYTQGGGGSRPVSSDLFIEETFAFYELPDPGPIPAWDKGRMLADALRRQRALLVLDGLESLQQPPGPNGRAGYLNDEGVRSLLRALASGQPGLCLVTTRLQVADLRSVSSENHRQMDLEQLDENAGAELLRHLLAPSDAPPTQRELVARTPDDELRRANREFGGHALALRLLGNYLATAYGGDVRRRDKIGPLLRQQETEGAHAVRVMRNYEDWFAHRPELEILLLLGLFDRPAESSAIAALRKKPAIPGLKTLSNLDDTGWNESLTYLRKAGLIMYNSDGALDCHPLVRQYFGQRLHTGKPTAWKEGHARLYRYFRELPNDKLPDKLLEMEPLFRAMRHGCHAEGFQDACRNVYLERIRRGNECYQLKNLAAYSETLASLSSFFVTRWQKPVPKLKRDVAALLLRDVGLCLMGLGRLDDAASTTQAAVQMAKQQRDWRSAAVSAWNRTWLLVALGDLSEAIAAGRESKECAANAKDPFAKMGACAMLGLALHNTGERDKAEKEFKEADAQHFDRKSEFDQLYPFKDLWYAELLIDKGDFAGIEGRARSLLDMPKDVDFPAVQGCHHLLLGWVGLKQMESRSPQSRKIPRSEKLDGLGLALDHFKKAIDYFRKVTRQDLLPRGLLARAECHRLAQGFSDARTDLDEVLELTTRCGMKLFQADCHLKYARLLLEEAHVSGSRHKARTFEPLIQFAAREHYEEAKKLVAICGYHRRDPELDELSQPLGA